MEKSIYLDIASQIIIEKIVKLSKLEESKQNVENLELLIKYKEEVNLGNLELAKKIIDKEKANNGK